MFGTWTSSSCEPEQTSCAFSNNGGASSPLFLISLCLWRLNWLQVLHLSTEMFGVWQKRDVKVWGFLGRNVRRIRDSGQIQSQEVKKKQFKKWGRLTSKRKKSTQTLRKVKLDIEEYKIMQRFGRENKIQIKH